jgi:phosphate transport system protein
MAKGALMSHFQSELEKLRKSLLSLGTLVEENLFRAAQAVADLDVGLSRQVMDADDRIDQVEVEVEEECLKILALYQPVASDLRYVVAALKINQDLERVGDLAVNVAKRIPRILEARPQGNLVDYAEMATLVRAQFRRALDSFIHLDAQSASEVIARDEEVDQFNKSIQANLAAQTRQDSSLADLMLLNVHVSKNLERIADHAKNIAEDVIYLVQGKVSRHHH